MIEDKLGIRLINSGFRRMDSNVGGIYLFYRDDDSDIKIISVINMQAGIELTDEQYRHILRQVKASFAVGLKRINLLNIFFTAQPEKVKRLCAETSEESHWIIDCSANRLIIYETQVDDFFGLKAVIEELLTQEQEARLSYEGARPEFADATVRRTAGGERARTLQISPVNLIIVLINVAVFIVVQSTSLFGGKNQVIEAGGLSWYLVKEAGQVYRIISSMFLHADISHLFNNMLLLLFIGSILERVAGKVRYLIIYFASGIIAAISSMGYNMLREYGKVMNERIAISIGASGAIFGVVGSILFIIIVSRGRLEYIGFRQIVLFIILSLYNGFANAQIDQAAHIGGFLAGFVLTALLYSVKKFSVFLNE